MVFIIKEPYNQNQYNILQKYLDQGIYAQIFNAFKNILSINFADYELYAAIFNSYTNLILNAGVETFKDALPYLFMAKILLTYGIAVYNLLLNIL